MYTYSWFVDSREYNEAGSHVYCTTSNCFCLVTKKHQKISCTRPLHKIRTFVTHTRTHARTHAHTHTHTHSDRMREFRNENENANV